MTAEPERATVLRLAGLHLRTGLLQLALAELEALAQRDSLDEAGLADLAEARWRTGDLESAGTVAVDLVERGSSSPLVLAIAAEAVAADGRATEARRLAARALEGAEVPLDTLFAGLPRHAIWPDEPAEVGLDTDVGEPAAPAPAVPPASAAAAGAYAGGRAALAAGDRPRAARRLGVALRLDPAFADQVLEAVGADPADPELALLAGDALRIVGREREALAAFDVAREAEAAATEEAPQTGDAAASAGPADADQPADVGQPAAADQPADAGPEA